MRRRVGGVAALVLAVVLGLMVWARGCTSSPPSVTGPSIHDAAQRYLAAARAANTRVGLAKAAMARDQADPDKVKRDLGEIASAKERFDSFLRTFVVPDSAKADLAALIAADADLVRTLRSAAGAATLDELQARQPAVVQAGVAEVAAANVVRRDLGLPPVPS
jgi:hypothetical protein